MIWLNFKKGTMKPESVNEGFIKHHLTTDVNEVCGPAEATFFHWK
jgi:hypothetical protein